MLEEFERYLLRKEHKSSSTVKTYSKCIEQFINWYNNSINNDIYNLDKELINMYKDYLSIVEKKKDQTINVTLCALSMLKRYMNYKNPPKNYIVRKKYKKVNEQAVI